MFTRDLPVPVLLLTLSFLCPTELSADIAGLRLPPHRVALILIVPFALVRLLSAKNTRLRTFDILIAAYAGWALYAYASHAPHAGSFVYGGSIALESFGAYLIARAYVRDLETLRATIGCLVTAVIIAGLIAWPETLLAKHFTHDLLQSLTGHVHPRAIETRLGLTRAYGTFDHPIHLGTFAATIFALAWYGSQSTGQRTKRASAIAATTFSALSSAPLLCLFTQAALIVWDRATRTLKGRVALTVTVAALAYTVLALVATRSPFALIATGLTLDSWTGYYRLLIWQYGLENVWAHPWIGLGLGDWERAWWMASDSVDAYWLVIAMQTGIPAFLLLTSALVFILFALARHAKATPDTEVHQYAKAWVISLLALSLIACTVHFWNVMHAYFFFFIGLSGWIADPNPLAQKRAPTRPAHGRPLRHHAIEPVLPGLAPAPLQGEPLRLSPDPRMTGAHSRDLSPAKAVLSSASTAPGPTVLRLAVDW